jgi:hypothetical protein
MQSKLHLPEGTIERFVERILKARQISRADQKILMAAFSSKDFLTRDDEILIDRIFDGLRSGLLRIVD